MPEKDFARMVGQAGRLPDLDLFGHPRQAGWTIREVGDGLSVAIPPATPDRIAGPLIVQVLQGFQARLGRAKRGASTPMAQETGDADQKD
jgi:hypothetical protein